jgi:hypothetical protein
MERNRFPWPSRKSNHKIGRRRFIGPDIFAQTGNLYKKPGYTM